jgi:prevent-host-death family protein
MMKSTGIKELRSSLTATLERVKAGEEILVTERASRSPGLSRSSRPSRLSPARSALARYGRRCVRWKELRSSLTATLERVKAGEEILVTEQGEPIARIVPIESPEQVLARKIRSGAIRPPLRPMDPATVEELFNMPRGEDPEGHALNALLEERGSRRI